MTFALWALVGAIFTALLGTKDECGLSCQCTWIEFPPMSGWVCRSPNGPACCCEGQDPLCADVSFQALNHYVHVILILPCHTTSTVLYYPMRDHTVLTTLQYRTALHSRSVLPPKASVSVRATRGVAPTIQNLFPYSPNMFPCESYLPELSVSMTRCK